MKKVFFLLCLLVGPGQTAEALEITFQPSCSVDDSAITLGDIARFDEQTEMTRALATLAVGQAAAPGEKSTLSSLGIKDSLTAIHSLSGEIVWSGSPTVTVVRRGENIGPERIETIIAEYIKRNINNLPEAEIRFVPSALPLPFMLPTGDLSHEVIPSNPDILGSSRLSIIFRIDGNVVKNMSVRGTVEALAHVVISAGPLKKGEILRPQHLSTATMDISSLDNAGMAMEDFVGKKLTRSLRAGSPVLLSMVETLPVVRRGERVKIVINSGALHVTAAGLAHSDGSLHQMIQVQNTNSNKIIYCRVAAPGLVEVIL
jgi:flagellar basal body P-ring formation protein FlgA